MTSRERVPVLGRQASPDVALERPDGAGSTHAQALVLDSALRSPSGRARPEATRLDAARLAALLELARLLATGPELLGLAAAVLTCARRLVRAERAHVWRLEPDGSRLRLLATTLPETALDEPSFDPAASVLGAALRTGRFRRLADLQLEARHADVAWYRLAGTRSLAIQPLGDPTNGLVLALSSRRCRAYTPAEMGALDILTELVASALRAGGETARVAEELERACQRGRELEEQLRVAEAAQGQLQAFAADFRRTYQESRRRLQQMEALYELSSSLGSTFDPNEVLQRTVQAIDRLVPHDAAAVYVPDDDGELRRAAVGRGERVPELPTRLALSSGPAGRSWREARLVQERRGASADPGRWLTCLPLRIGGEAAGLLVLVRDERPLSDEEQRALELLAASAAMALQNARLATTDPLTGLYNRRYFERGLALEIERARRAGRPLGLITIDIDHFKDFNEQHGHPAGDEVLRVVAWTIAQQLRRTDVVARVGGEEFSVVLPEQNRRAVRIAAERIRRAVEEAPAITWNGRELPAVRVSVGGAAVTADEVEAELLIGRADRALRSAKRHGRNRVHLASARRADEPPRDEPRKV